MKYALAVDLGGTYIKAGLVAQDGTMTHTRQVRTSADAGGAVVGSQIAEVARAIFAESALRRDIVGIGLGSPGLISADTGVIHFSPNFEGWTDIPLADYVKAELRELSSLPVFLENDVNAMTLGELTFGAGKGCRYLVGMTLGTGVGGGVVIDGKVYHGKTNMAGEIGHMTVLPDGRQCGCGNFGCLEAMVGTAGLIERTRAKMSAGARSRLLANIDDLTPRMIADAAKEGDGVALDIFAETGRYIGIILGSIANLLNPEMAVIGGGISAAGEEILFRHIRDEARRRAMDTPADTMRIVPAALGNDAGMAGAATLAFQAAGVLPS
ncbi:ROK family protein [Candidatus Poribacteria bacterium]|nr:ROK family protein [Candidatus Poribacteria bacterium]